MQCPLIVTTICVMVCISYASLKLENYKDMQLKSIEAHEPISYINVC